MCGEANEPSCTEPHSLSATEAWRHLAVRKPPTVAEAGLHGVSSDAIHFQYDLKRDIYRSLSLQRLLLPHILLYSGTDQGMGKQRSPDVSGYKVGSPTTMNSPHVNMCLFFCAVHNKLTHFHLGRLLHFASYRQTNMQPGFPPS